jgi:ABC-type uncharacterized transport system auxiliary subunit
MPCRTANETRRRTLAALPLLATPALLLAGCSLGSAPRRDFHLLRDAGAPGAALPGPRSELVLLVATLPPPGLYDNDRMVFSADGRARSYFQFGFWSERPAQSLQTLAQERLAQALRWRDVASSTSGVRGDQLLSLRLDELYMDASAGSAQARLGATAELIDWRNRQLLARRSFAQVAPLSSPDAVDFAEAASRAMGKLLDDLVAWAASRASTGAPA